MVLQRIVTFRRRSLNPVNSLKHIIDAEGTLLATGAASTVPLVTGVPNIDPAVFDPSKARVGSVINAFFITVFVIGASGANIGGSINWYLWKQRSTQDPGPIPDAVGTSNLRNQVIHQEKGLAGSGDGTPMAFKGVIVVPRGMRRMREGDEWQIKLNLNAVAATDASFCVRAIFKSFN